jgi:membrane-anchored glycerophosphoryl diester phosphodiesterase (GDPDase)
VIGANLIISLPFLLLALPLAYGLLNSGITATTVNPKIPATMLFYAMLLIGLIAYVSVRLVVINQVLMAKKRGVVESLRDAWTMTRPVLWQILGVAILFVVVSFIVSGAATAIFGSLFVLGAKAMGSPFLGAVLTALMGGMISAGFSIISTVFVTFLYSRLVPSSNGI